MKVKFHIILEHIHFSNNVYIVYISPHTKSQYYVFLLLFHTNFEVKYTVIQFHALPSSVLCELRDVGEGKEESDIIMMCSSATFKGDFLFSSSSKNWHDSFYLQMKMKCNYFKVTYITSLQSLILVYLEINETRG